MLRALLFVCCLFASTLLMAQSGQPWSIKNQSEVSLPAGAEQNIEVNDFVLLQLQPELLKRQLAPAPKEFGARSEVIIALPMPNGRFERFAIYSSPVMRPGLAAKYPGIRSFAAHGYDRPSLYGRIGYTYKGFHASISTPEGTIYIDPFSDQMEDHYMSYYVHNIPERPSFVCGVEGKEVSGPPLEGMHFDEHSEEEGTVSVRGARGALVDLLVYDFALACTGEFGVMHGGDPLNVASIFDIAVNRMNLDFEQEVAIRLMLIDNNDDLIFVDPNNDPYDNPTNGTGLLPQNKFFLDGFIKPENYDIGHVFTIRCTDVGGVVSGSTCGVNKGRGVTCMGNTNVEFFVSQIMTHEVGHQFSAGHSWNNCPGNEGQLASSSAFEPGSGTTIMSYAGACGPSNVAFRNDDYYHVGTLDEIYFFSRTGPGNTCADVISTNNHLPDITEWSYTDGFYIPIETPFELDAAAADEDGDNLTYCWEQYNLGPSSPLGMPRGDAPIFRSFPPRSETNRVFPRLDQIVANNTFNLLEEMLPTYTRNLNFRCTVRDNNPEVGGVIWQEVAFKVTEAAGPFAVSHPNGSNVQWEGSSYTEVRWLVNNTDLHPVNCKLVDIKLSLDGGFTYPITLAESAPNDGSHFITVPNDITTTRARVRVQAANNIFFDISNRNFQITPSTQPTYTLDPTPFIQQVCLPDAAVFDFNTTSILDYDQEINFAFNGLPPGATASFSSNPIRPNESSSLIINMDAVTVEDTFDIEVMAVAQGADTAYRYVTIITVNNDFSSIALMEPLNGSNGVTESPNFIWDGSVNANSYEIEIATSPSFGNTIIQTANGLTVPNHLSSDLLEKNTAYFWRIRPLNECGYGAYSPVYAFHTASLTCEKYTSSAVPVLISSQGLPVVESTIAVIPDGEINDINVTNLVGQHDLVKHITVSLISPIGKEVQLFTDLCGNTQLFNLGLDDQAPSAIPCPPVGGQPHIPQEPLSKFHGDRTSGTWTLRTEVIDTDGEGGGISAWQLEFCSNISLNSPFLVNNEGLAVRPGEGKRITTDLLLSEDNNNTAEELTYTIVEVPKHGELRLNNVVVKPGDTFRQSDIDSNLFRYKHNGDDAMEDNFNFTVDDGEGGWFGVPVFTISIDEDATVSTGELSDLAALRLYPNPASSVLHLLFEQEQEQTFNYSLINIQGQILSSGQLKAGSRQTSLDISPLVPGLYFIRIESTNQLFTRKFSVQR